MKKILFLISLISLASCQDVVDVDVPTEEPRLVVQALIRVDPTSPTTTVAVKATTTSGFFGEPKPAKLNNIFLSIPGTSTFINLFEIPEGSGIYQPSADEVNPSPIATSYFTDNEEHLLTINFEDKIFLAFSGYYRSTPLDNLAQGRKNLFDDDETEIITTFTDRPNEDNFYILDYSGDGFLPTEDTFYKDQQFTFSYFYGKPLVPGDELTVNILGSDRSFYNYMNQLIEQSDDEPNPFQTPTNTVRGNIINATDIDNIDNFDNVNQPNNFALGYFAISEVFTRTLIIE